MTAGGALSVDLAVALRRWRRAPLATLAVLLTLAAVIGTEGLLLASIDLVLLRRSPYSDVDRLVVLWERNPSLGLERVPVAAGDFADWRQEARSFTGLAAIHSGASLLDTGGRLMQVKNARVSPDLFPVLGLRLALGSGFTPARGNDAPADEIILSHSLWKSAFGGDPRVLGRACRLDGRPFTIVGVAPGGAELPKGTEVWIADRFERGMASRVVRNLMVIGRLRPGVSLAAAQAEMDAVAQQLLRLHPESNRGFGTALMPLALEVTRTIRPTLLFLFGAATLAVVIGCLNLSNLELVRTARRRRELAIRMVLGADGLPLWRPVLVESLLLALTGGFLGFVVALWGGPGVMRLSPVTAGLMNERFVPPLLGSVLWVAAVAGLMIGSIPVLYLLLTVQGVPLSRQVGEGSGGSLRFSRLQRALLVLQVALSLPLLVGGCVLLQNFLRLKKVDPGFQPRGVVAMGLTLPDAQVAAAARGAVSSVLERVTALPWVSRAAVVSNLPLGGTNTSSTFTIVGRPLAPGEAPPNADQRSVSPGYFAALSIPRLRGRVFGDLDSPEGTTVCIVNDLLARRFWPGQDPIGQVLYLGSPQEIALFGHPVPWRIVGVVGNVRHVGLEEDFRPEIYLPYAQMPVGFVSLVARTRVGTPASLAELRAVVTGLGDQVRPGRAEWMEEIVADAVGRPGIQTFFFVLFMAVSVLLVAMSTYALVAHSVSEGARGIGISLALGAQAHHVLALVLREMSILCVVGLALGVLLGMAGIRLLAHAIFLLAGGGPAVYAGAILLLAGLVAASSLLPARRALDLDPTRLLRREA
jgi:putative ABC transport system permease protein